MSATAMSSSASAPAALSASVTDSATALASAPANLGSAGGGLWSSFFVILLVLILISALAWLLPRLLKRTIALRTRDGQASSLRVIQTVALGARERLVIVRRGDQEYVLGVTAASVNLIDKHGIHPADPPPAVDKTS